MARSFQIYAPLHDFCWQGHSYVFGSRVLLRRFAQTPDLSGLEAHVSKPEWDRVVRSDHWLAFEWSGGEELSPAEVANLVLLSLWLVKPTRAQVALRFEIGHAEAAGEKKMSRVLNRFAWIPRAIDPDVSNEDIRQAATYYSKLEAICRRRGRLNNASVLTVTGCWSHGWQTALICYAAAAETILTFSKDHGLTRRLATSYACIVASESSTRDAAFIDFMELYSLRSDVVHGRMHHIARSEALETLLRFQIMLRRVWVAVLGSQELLSALELDDAGRRAYLNGVEAGYKPPQP